MNFLNLNDDGKWLLFCSILNLVLTFFFVANNCPFWIATFPCAMICGLSTFSEKYKN